MYVSYVTLYAKKQQQQQQQKQRKDNNKKRKTKQNKQTNKQTNKTFRGNSHIILGKFSMLAYLFLKAGYLEIGYLCDVLVMSYA